MQPAVDHWYLIAELIEAWEAKSHGGSVVAKRRPSLADYPVLHGLAAHAHRQAKAALILQGEGLTMEAIPLVRAAYETAITAAWISLVDDGLAAFGQEDARNHENRIKLVKKLYPTAEENPSTVETIAAIKAMDTSAAGRARNFGEICEDLEQVGDRGYFFYRALSTYSHPNTDIANLYMEPPTSDAELPTLRWAPRAVLIEAWASLLFGSLIWVGQAVETREGSQSGRKKYLRGMAEKGGVAAQLTPTQAVRDRQIRATRERKARERAAQEAARAERKTAKK